MGDACEGACHLHPCKSQAFSATCATAIKVSGSLTGKREIFSPPPVVCAVFPMRADPGEPQAQTRALKLLLSFKK